MDVRCAGQRVNSLQLRQCTVSGNGMCSCCHLALQYIVPTLTVWGGHHRHLPAKGITNASFVSVAWIADQGDQEEVEPTE